MSRLMFSFFLTFTSSLFFFLFPFPAFLRSSRIFCVPFCLSRVHISPVHGPPAKRVFFFYCSFSPLRGQFFLAHTVLIALFTSFLTPHSFSRPRFQLFHPPLRSFPTPLPHGFPARGWYSRWAVGVSVATTPPFILPTSKLPCLAEFAELARPEHHPGGPPLLGVSSYGAMALFFVSFLLRIPPAIISLIRRLFSGAERLR